MKYLDKPTLLLGEKVFVMKDNAKVGSAIIKFSEERRQFSDTEKFFNRHIEILSMAFEVSELEIKKQLKLAEIVRKYLDCLKYVASTLGKVADKLEKRKAGGQKIPKSYRRQARL